MPVFRHDEPVPEWCELRAFEIVQLQPGESITFSRAEPKEKTISGRGACLVQSGGERIELAETKSFDLPAGVNHWQVTAASDPVTIIRMSGRWGDDYGGAGIFGVIETGTPSDPGDPVDYPKRTKFDAHYHDCDEYWILFEGRGTAVSEGQHYLVGPGDCIATGMGHHHDFPLASEPVRAVFFETTLEGQKRRGHLWNHTHGPANPNAERV